MGHNLATIDGRIAMAYTGDTPWHSLGNRMEGDLIHSIRRAMEAANLNWDVSKQPAFAKVGEDFLPIPHRQAIVRDVDSAVLGIVSDGYTVIQNSAIEDVFQHAMEEFNLTVEAAGALGRGEKVWVLFKLPSTTQVVDGDYVNGYGLVILGHDGLTCFEFRPTPIRVICQNTMNMAVGAGGENGRMFGIYHRADADKEIELARALVHNALAAMEATCETFTSMAQRHMTPAEVIAFIEGVFPTPKDAKDGNPSAILTATRQKVAELVWQGQGADMAMQDTHGEPNPWACYNAVTAYFDHVVLAEAKSDHRRLSTAKSAIFGTYNDIKLNALKRAQQLVAA
jgi:phage/plasmid-like protein (TIGR03299 family)